MPLNITAAREKIASARAKLTADEAELERQFELEATAERRAALDAFRSRLLDEQDQHIDQLIAAAAALRAAFVDLTATANARNLLLDRWRQELRRLDVPTQVGVASPSSQHGEMAVNGNGSVQVDNVVLNPVPAQLVETVLGAARADADGLDVAAAQTDPRPLFDSLIINS